MSLCVMYDVCHVVYICHYAVYVYMCCSCTTVVVVVVLSHVLHHNNDANKNNVLMHRGAHST